MKCQKCGAEITAQDKFCMKCGAEIPKENRQEAEKEERKGLLKNKKMIALIAGAIFFFFLGDPHIAGLLIYAILLILIGAIYEFYWYPNAVINPYVKAWLEEGGLLEMPMDMSIEDIFRLLQEKLIYPHRKIEVKLGLGGNYELQIETNIKGSLVSVAETEKEGKKWLYISPAGKFLDVSYPEAKLIKNEISKILLGKPADVSVQDEALRVKRWGFDLKVVRIWKRFKFAVIALVAIACILIFLKRQDIMYVESVKQGSPQSYPGITYEEAFHKFFENPKWKYFESDAGQKIVEFTGKCFYHDQKVTVTMQFIISEDEKTFELGYCGMNDIPQNALMSWALVSSAFDEYGN